MGLTVTAVEFDENLNWSFLPEDSKLLETFRRTHQEFDSIGISIDSDIANGGLDRNKAVEMLFLISNHTKCIDPDTACELAAELTEKNYDKTEFDVNELSVGVFLGNCTKHKLGFVFV